VGIQFIPFFIALVVLMALWWLMNGPQRRFLARQSEISNRAIEASRRQTEATNKYIEYLTASRANSDRQNELLERIAVALERNEGLAKDE
jgi:hypothetical protein